jgi:hypothetical protein
MMVKKSCFILFLFTLLTSAQSPAIQWQKSFGGSNVDLGYGIKQTSDGGYIFVSNTQSSNGDITGHHGGFDIWVVKISSSGILEWQRALGGSGSDLSQTIDITSDGGYIVAGYTDSDDGDINEEHDNFCSWIIKLSAIGEIEWQNIYVGNGYNQVHTIQQTLDGGYIVAGYDDTISDNPDGIQNHGGNDYLVMKLSSIGDVEWQKSLGGTQDDYAICVRQTSDGGYVVAGESVSSDGDVTENYGGSDYWIVKLSNLGDIEWQKSLGGSDSENPISIYQTTDGGYIISGRTQSSDGDVTDFHGMVDAWIVKLNSTGTLVWQKTLGGSSSEVISDVKQISDGGYILVGSTNSFDGDVFGNHGGGDCWAVRLSSSGNIIWQKCFGGTLGDFGARISLTIDGGYIISANSFSIDGDRTNYYGNHDNWIIKLEPDVLSTPDFSTKDLKIHPNPVASILTLHTGEDLTFDSIVISDLTSKIVIEQIDSGGQIDVSCLEKGVYLLQAFSKEQKFIGKFVKE